MLPSVVYNRRKCWDYWVMGFSIFYPYRGIDGIKQVYKSCVSPYKKVLGKEIFIENLKINSTSMSIVRA